MNPYIKAPQLLCIEGIDYHPNSFGTFGAKETFTYAPVGEVPDETSLVTLDWEGIDQVQSKMLGMLDPKRDIKWSRHSGYQCSTAGDSRFSALMAIMPDGRSLEAWYQCGTLDGLGKGYEPGGTNWRLGKGKGPVRYKTAAQSWEEYAGFWRLWASEHLHWMRELLWRASLEDYLLADIYASSPVSQARALALCLNELRKTPTKPAHLP